MNLGFIGFGEAAFEIARGLKQQGFERLVAYDPVWNHATYGSLVQSRAAEAQVLLITTPEDVLSRVQVVFAAVPADKALGVSEVLKPHLKKGDLYIDVSASTPTVKRSIWDNIKANEVTFVDAAMMGPLSLYQHRVPILASGSGTDQFIEMMTPYGMEITKISENPGDASVVKLIRSIYMKGTAALLFELLGAAKVLDVEELVLDSLSESFDGVSFVETVNRLVTGTSIHAQRRAVEVEGSIEMLESMNLDSTMSKAARDKLVLLSRLNLKERFQGKKPENWVAVLEAMNH